MLRRLLKLLVPFSMTAVAWVCYDGLNQRVASALCNSRWDQRRGVVSDIFRRGWDLELGPVRRRSGDLEIREVIGLVGDDVVAKVVVWGEDRDPARLHEGGSGSFTKENGSSATTAAISRDWRTSWRGRADWDLPWRRTNLRRWRRRDHEISRGSENLPETRGGSGSGAKEIKSRLTAAARSENLQETRGRSATWWWNERRRSEYEEREKG